MSRRDPSPYSDYSDDDSIPGVQYVTGSYDEAYPAHDPRDPSPLRGGEPEPESDFEHEPYRPRYESPGRDMQDRPIARRSPSTESGEPPTHRRAPISRSVSSRSRTRSRSPEQGLPERRGRTIRFGRCTRGDQPESPYSTPPYCSDSEEDAELRRVWHNPALQRGLWWSDSESGSG